MIVGGGPVCSRLLRELLQRAPALPVVTYDCEPWDPYDRVQLASVLSGELGWADLDDTFLLPEEHQVIRRRELITAIDRENRTITDLQGRQQAYSILVLVTGSYTNFPSLPGTHLKGVYTLGIYTLHDKSDLKRLLNRRKDSRRIVVMGGGVLGLEIACALQSDSTTVYILQNDRLMQRQLDQRASAILLDHLRALGFQVILDRAKEILGTDTVTGIRTYSGELIECDTIVLATGVQPGVKLALKAGLKVGRGIKVNDQMQTSDPCIYAVGDCAEHRGRVYGLALPGFEQAKVAAENILGGQASYLGSMAVTKLKGVTLPVFHVGRLDINPPAYEELVYEQREDNIYRKLLLHRGRLRGALAVGEWPEGWQMQDTARYGRWLWPWQRQRFRTTGSLWPQRGTPPVAEWPVQATVCNCQGITRGILTQAMAAGYTTVEALQQHTGAGTDCGACKPLLAQLVGQAVTAQSVQGEKTLLGVCGAALLLVLAIGVLPPLLPAASMQGGWHLETLWLDSLWKQVSGYSLLVLSLLALTLSLRKRWPRFALGSFASWRLLHGILGVLTLGLLIAHTGLHLGRNPLNLSLTVCFLGLILGGSIAGGMTVFEGRSPSPALSRWRARWVQYHTWLFWPVPVLLAFHILVAYYF